MGTGPRTRNHHWNSSAEKLVPIATVLLAYWMWILISVRDNTDLQSVRTMEARTIDKCTYADICSWKKLSEVISNMKCAGMFRGQDDKIKLPFYLRILIPKLCCTKGHQGNRSYCVYAWNTHLSGLTEKVTRAFRNKPTTVSKSLPSQSTLQWQIGGNRIQLGAYPKSVAPPVWCKRSGLWQGQTWCSSTKAQESDRNQMRSIWDILEYV